MNKKILFSGILVLIFSFIGCDQGTGTSPESEALSTVDFNTDGSGYANLTTSSGTKTITVKFIVKNGGCGLFASNGIVSTQDDSYLVKDGDAFADDFYITITIPEDNQYVNIRWKGISWDQETYLKVKMSVGGGGNYKITLDYNGYLNVATENLFDVQCKDQELYYDFLDAWDHRSVWD